VHFAHGVLLRGEMALVGAPPISVEAGDPKRREQRLQLQKDLILSSPKNVCQYLPTVVIDRLPQPPRGRFLAHITPHPIEFCGRAFPLGELLPAANVHLYLLGL